MAPADCVAPDVVGEVFFVHQRGRAMAIYTVFLSLGSLVGALSGSYIAAARGWRWTQWVNTILAGSVLILCFFFQPETLYGKRQGAAHCGTTAKTTRPAEPSPTSLIIDEKDQVSRVEEDPSVSESSASYAPFTFTRSLRIGVYRGNNILGKFIGPVLTLRYPGTWLVMLQYGGLVGGIVTISAIGPQLVAGPPYLWGQNAGAIDSGGIIGTVLGAIYAYLVTDWSIKRQAARDARRGGRGYAEPESRLLTMIPSLFVATTGLWVFGFSAQYPGGRNWVGLQFGLGMLAFGLMQVPSVGFNYIIEAYNAVSGDCFVMITTLRAIISFAWTFFVSSWVQDRGPAEPFGIFGAKAGIGIGVIAAVCSICAIAWLFWRRLLSLHHSQELEEAVEKNSITGGTAPRAELDGTTCTVRNTSDATSDPKIHSYQPFRSSIHQQADPGNYRANESGAGDELFIPKSDHRPIHRSQAFVTNSDLKQESEQSSPTHSDTERPRILSIGRPPRDVPGQYSIRSSQDEQRSLVSQVQIAQNCTVSGLIEEQRRLDEQIAEAKRLTNLYQRKDRIQTQLRERTALEEGLTERTPCDRQLQQHNTW
ncbi:MAG: hypothetical protein Q9165_000283 [Trypethelium subeluteriae]